jgi:membrane protease YdiL (CAAX protease family)
MFKRISEWLKKPFFKRSADSDEIVKFSALGNILGERPWIVFGVTLLLVMIVEVPLRAEAFVSGNYRLIWLAATIIGFLFLLVFKIVGKTEKDYLVNLYFDIKIKDVLYGLLMGVIAFFWALSLNYLYSNLFPNFYSSFLENRYLFLGINLLLAIASAGILRPLGEEILFRGYFFEKYKQKFGISPGILLSSFIFGIRSLDPFLFIMNFGNGILFSLTAHKFQIKSAIFSSIFFNLFLILSIVVFGE